MSILPVSLGLDYHSDSIRVCVMTADGAVLANRSVASDVAGVVAVVRALKVAVRVTGAAIETCGGAAEFAVQLTEATGWPVRMAHAAAVHRLKQGPDKTDHGDAWHLANLLRVKYLPEVWIADATTRQLRHLVRHRQALVADAKDIKLRIRALLKEDRIPEVCPATSWTKTWLAWLRQVVLPEQTRWIIDRQLELLAGLEQQLAAVDQRMEATTANDPIVRKLREQPGVGLVTALLLRAVVGRFDRFRNGKQLSRYCGVTPCNASSGKRQADAGLVQAGHDDLRVALIQLAKRLPRHEPRWRERRSRRVPPAEIHRCPLESSMEKPNSASARNGPVGRNRWLRRLDHELVPKTDPALAH